PRALCRGVGEAGGDFGRLSPRQVTGSSGLTSRSFGDAAAFACCRRRGAALNRGRAIDASYRSDGLAAPLPMKCVPDAYHAMHAPAKSSAGSATPITLEMTRSIAEEIRPASANL